MRIVVGLDSAWGGTGWCVATERGPLEVGQLTLTGTWRLVQLRAFLDGELSRALTDAELLLGPTDPPVRVVVEKPPDQYAAGTQAAAIGIARLLGALQLWGLQPGRLAYPDEVEPNDWRARWGIAPPGRNRTREVLKFDAIAKVRATYGAEWLAPYPLGAPAAPRRKGRRSSFAPLRPPMKYPTAGPQGDVAEAILIAVDGARNYDAGPAGPAGWRRSPPKSR